MEELRKYSCIENLGRGSFGNVCLVRRKSKSDADEIYAMKLVSSAKHLRQVNTEKSILSNVDHRFIVKLFYAFEVEEIFYFILEYIEGGTLKHLLACRPEKMLTESEAAFYIKEMVIGIEYLHSEGIIHRDIKPANILLDKTGHIKISDFGLSLQGFSPDSYLVHERRGTLKYLPPELLKSTGYGFTMDWYAMGVTLFEMVTGKCPFVDTNVKRLAKLIMNGMCDLPAEFCPCLRSLTMGLLENNPQKRLGRRGSTEIKRHRFFRKTSWNIVSCGLETPPFVPPYEESTKATFLKCDCSCQSQHANFVVLLVLIFFISTIAIVFFSATEDKNYL